MKVKTQTVRSSFIVTGMLFGALVSAVAESEVDFASLDANEDGRVSSIEHITFSDRVFKQSDANRDNKVSMAEWDAAAQASQRKFNKEEAHAQLRMRDLDGDGIVTPRESTHFAAMLFAQADKNGDGVLTEAEFKTASKELKKAKLQL